MFRGRAVVIFGLILCFCTGAFALPKVYVGSMGHSDDAERFRMLVRTELDKLNVPTVDAVEQADATLAGVLAARVDERGRATVELTDKHGGRLWRADIGPGTWARYDELKTRAKKIARELKKALERMPSAQN
jgi:hypothetical protein